MLLDPKDAMQIFRQNGEPDFTTLRLRFALTVGNRTLLQPAKPATCRTARALSVCVQRRARTLTLRLHEVPAMIFRVVIPLLLVPVLAVTLPLMFALAWLHEAVDDMGPARQAPNQS
jgi:hypothetical protein